MLLLHRLKDGAETLAFRLVVALVGAVDHATNVLRREQIMLAELDRMPLAEQQREDVDIVLARLRPVDQIARAGALAQRIVDILRVVREHAKGAVAAHNGVGAGEALHQHRRDLLLPRRGLPVAALARDLVDVVDGAEADHPRVHHVLDEGLGVLPRLPLIAVDVVHREVLVAERIARIAGVFVQQPAGHLDQQRLARARLAVADEGEDEAAQLDEGIELSVEVVGHQHFRQLHALILGDMVAYHLIRPLEVHHHGAGTRQARLREPIDGEVVRLDPVAAGKEAVEIFKSVFSEG